MDTVVESYIFSIILYMITILALIGGIHLIYNICICKRKCYRFCKCFKCCKHRKIHDYDDYDMESESCTSMICKIVCVCCIICFEIFLFVGCYQQSMYNDNDNHSLLIFKYHSIEQCRILFCFIGFYVYGKMLLYAYFVIRAYNMLEGSQLNYNRNTVIIILSIYFIMMNFILFSMIYVHLADDHCNVNQLNEHFIIHQKRTIVFGIDAFIDGSMAILSVSLLIHKLFALVRQSMNVHGGLSKITPHPSPANTPRSSININIHSQQHQNQQNNHSDNDNNNNNNNMHRLRSQSNSSITTSSFSPNTKIVIKSYKFNNNIKKEEIHNKLAKEKENKQKIDNKNKNKKEIEMMITNHLKKHQKQNRRKQKNIFINRNNVIMDSIRRCSRSTNDDESGDDSNNSLPSNPSNPSNANHSNPSSTRQSIQNNNRRSSRSITPEIDQNNNNINNDNKIDDGLPSILSNHILIDDDIDKVKKLSIGLLLKKDELIELENKYKESDANNHGNNDGNNDEDDVDQPFVMIPDDDHDLNQTDKTIENEPTPEIMLSLNYQDDDDEDDDDDDNEEEEEMKELSPLAPRNSLLCDISSDTLQIPSIPSNPKSNTSNTSNSAHLTLNNTHSPRDNSIISTTELSRRSSSIFVVTKRASEIVNNISNEHIRRFHNLTQYDNEILLLSTKLLILLTICVISSFCSFLILFGIIRINQNNGIFFVYGIDSFINIWCLSFTFKFSNRCYNILFNCGTSNRSTKLCFPMVKTAALTWKFICCLKLNKHNKCKKKKKKNKLTIEIKHNNAHKNGYKNGLHQVHQNSTTYSNCNYRLSVDNVDNGRSNSMYCIEENDINNDDNIVDEHDIDDDESQCHMNCCFCCWGNEQEIQIYHMAKREVELMLCQNSKLFK